MPRIPWEDVRVPWWARWLTVGPLSRPGTKADLQAIEWIIAQAPNPNSRPIRGGSPDSRERTLQRLTAISSASGLWPVYSPTTRR